MKRLLRFVLHRIRPTTPYRWLRYHPLAIQLHRAIWSYRGGLTRQEQHNFQQLLACLPTGSPRLVFDLGAHRGDLTEAFLAAGFRTVSVEANPQFQKILHRRFGSHPNFTLVRAAVSDQRGTATFHLNHRRDARSTLSHRWNDLQPEGPQSEAMKVPTRTLADLVEAFGMPALIKIDVEGAEREVLSTLPTPVPLLTFEANLPEFAEETKAIFTQLTTVYGQYRIGKISDRIEWIGTQNTMKNFDFSVRRSFDFIIARNDYEWSDAHPSELEDPH